MSSPFRLDGKRILITGASSGIGRATAIECGKAGSAECILLGRNREELERTCAMLPDGCTGTIAVCDLSDNSALEEVVKIIGLLDGVVCNAGINKMRTLQFYTEKDLDDIFTVNCFAPILLVKHLVKKKKLAGAASIVFTASISGYSNVSVGNGVYGASKSALSAFMKYAALELAPKGIRCNAVHPGRIDTPLIHNGVTNEEDMRRDMERYPLRRYGKPEEVAYSIIYLLSDAAGWITGTDLLIDGGRSLV
ncbi:MAG: SDR family oxidoreductase [Muribaculaceae bacterium]|nr:SDR family oxidoreductase [Muribaculaceae bacterium]